MQTIEAQCKQAFESARSLINATTENKNKALETMASAIESNIDDIISANQKDIENGQKNGLSQALIDRLTLTPDRLAGISDSLRVIASLRDPVGEVLSGWTQPNGLRISKVRVPLGVIGIIYEARPNVTADAIGLAIKTSNAVVLRGSSSAYQSNKALADILRDALSSCGFDGQCIQLLEDTSHEGVTTFVQMKEYLSLVIPRGGASLIQRVVNTATVPAIETGVGNCHVYIDDAADLDKAFNIAVNAKTHRPSVCNACETILIHQAIAPEFLPRLMKELASQGVEIRGCEQTKALFPDSIAAKDEDWDTEFLDMIIAVKVVKDLDDALDHLKKHTSHHSEAIVSNDLDAVNRFKREVDAAAVLVNASTRFTDGGEFGFGAEMGISTQKLHARGPMGVTELTTYKYIVEGDGHIR